MHVCLGGWYMDSAGSWTTQGLNLDRGKDFSLLWKSRLAMGPTQCHNQWVQVALSLQVKDLWCACVYRYNFIFTQLLSCIMDPNNPRSKTCKPTAWVTRSRLQVLLERKLVVPLGLSLPSTNLAELRRFWNAELKKLTSRKECGFPALNTAHKTHLQTPSIYEGVQHKWSQPNILFRFQWAVQNPKNNPPNAKHETGYQPKTLQSPTVFFDPWMTVTLNVHLPIPTDPHFNFMIPCHIYRHA
jgi:hypothetical protein